MKLDGRQLVLDTNILVFWLRGQAAGHKLSQEYGLGTRRPRPIVPVVVKGEIKSLALKFQWGPIKSASLNTLLAELPLADISHDVVVDAYAYIDDESHKLGRQMGKNDLWIAALARVQEAVVLTTDRDFDHLHPSLVEIEWIDPASLVANS